MAKAKFYISAERLEARGACEEGVQQFRQLFGDDKVPVTRKTLGYAAYMGLDTMWLFELLDPATEYYAWRKLYISQNIVPSHIRKHREYLDALWAAIEKKAEEMKL